MAGPGTRGAAWIATRLLWRGTNRRRSMFASCWTMLSATSESGVSYPTPRTPLFPTRLFVTRLTPSEWTSRLRPMVAPVGGPTSAPDCRPRNARGKGRASYLARPRFEIGNTSIRTTCLAGGKRVLLPFEGAPIETAAQLTVSDAPLRAPRHDPNPRSPRRGVSSLCPKHGWLASSRSRAPLGRSFLGGP
jgi:hypothetical protein